MSKTKTMYGVEHTYRDGGQTYEIFPTLREAEAFSVSNAFTDDNHIPLFIFKADFGRDMIFIEDGLWNYEDTANTITGNYEVIKELNQYPNDYPI